MSDNKQTIASAFFNDNSSNDSGEIFFILIISIFGFQFIKNQNKNEAPIAEEIIEVLTDEPIIEQKQQIKLSEHSNFFLLNCRMVEDDVLLVTT